MYNQKLDLITDSVRADDISKSAVLADFFVIHTQDHITYFQIGYLCRAAFKDLHDHGTCRKRTLKHDFVLIEGCIGFEGQGRIKKCPYSKRAYEYPDYEGADETERK